MRSTIEAGYTRSANTTARGAASAFLQSDAQSQDITGRLHDEITDEPSVIGIWIVDLTDAGAAVVASSQSGDIGRKDIIGPDEIQAELRGVILNQRETSNGQPVLETISPVTGGRFAVVVATSLRSENEAVLQTVLWIVAVGIAVSMLEVASLTTMLEWTVVRRIRRVHHRGARRPGLQRERDRRPERAQGHLD